MPLITVSLYPGRTQQQKDDYVKAITKSAVEILKTKENHVIVVFDEKGYTKTRFSLKKGVPGGGVIIMRIRARTPLAHS
jgi:4-oxalocrotonate tautomerase